MCKRVLFAAALGALLAVPAGAAGAQSAGGNAPMNREQITAVLREIGPQIEVARTTGLYAPLLSTGSHPGVAVRRDESYGPHERHVLDLFTRAGERAQSAPVVVFVHGGGFARGSKHQDGSPFYDNIGVWAARQGFVGVTINYRLAPEFQFPSGVEDLARVVAWLRGNVAGLGGDPQRIYLWGHSAGAAHVADYVARTAQPAIAGAVLTSGIYHIEEGGKVSRWKDYYGEDVSKYRERSSVAGLVKSSVPLLVVHAELDPPEFIADTQQLIEALGKAGREVKTLFLPGHSHISETYAIGTDDESLSGPVRAFVTGAAR